MDIQSKDISSKFSLALLRQVERKRQLCDGIANMKRDPYKMLASIIEEAGEVASDLQRERYYGVIAECIDVAHSALLLAASLDPNGETLDSLFNR